MSLVVLAPGVFTTIQDLGRDRFRSRGVPIGGAFDASSAAIANALVGNPFESAVLEMTFLGGTFEATAPLALALCGAPMSASVRRKRGPDTVLDAPIAFPINPGEQLMIGGTSTGARTYLAVRGGWRTEEILGSRSSEKPLKSGDVLACESSTTPIRRLRDTHEPLPITLRVVDGPDVALVDPSWIDPERIYRVDPRSDRMGVRLDGPPCDVRDDHERLSTPVSPGAVQMAGGIPLVLGVACGTMGGYPHVAQVISADFAKLAQTRPGDSIRFERISLTEARILNLTWRSALRNRCLAIRAAALDLSSNSS